MVSISVKDIFNNQRVGDLGVNNKTTVGELLFHVQKLFCFLVDA